MTELPRVSVLVTACGQADGLAASLESALSQHYPAELLELVVVHDGGEPAIEALARCSAPERLRALAQPGAGRLAATARALGEARGEVLALLEPGDRWPVARLAGQVAALREEPEVGLVCSELLSDDDAPGARPVGRLLREPPCVGSSSIALRASLLPLLGPLPPELPAAAWWLVVRAACVAQIAWAPAGVTQRAEDDQRDDAPREDLLREALAVQRWFLRTATSESPYADVLGEIWRSFAANARRLLAVAGGDPFTELVTVTDAERSEARRALADARAALARGDTWPATALAVRAAALDPWCAPARELVAETVAARPRRVAGDPLAGARRFVTLAFAEELLERPQLLAAYGARFGGGEDATLAIDASGLLPATAGQRLGELVAELGLDGEGTAHLIAVLGPIDASVRARLPARADALLTSATPDAGSGVPAFDAASIDALHALACRASAA